MYDPEWFVYAVIGTLFAVGIIIGPIGSRMAMRRYLKYQEIKGELFWFSFCLSGDSEKQIFNYISKSSAQSPNPIPYLV